MAFIVQPSTHTARLNGLRAFSRNSASLRMSASDTLFKDWKATTAFLFPGQGAQYVGMAGKLVSEVPKAKEMFQQASEVLGYDLLKICLEGPKDKLDSTVISQPAIYVASLAAVEKLRNDAGQAAIDKATVAAGLSLGEYTALSFAGAISFEDGLRIVKTRGEAMQAASEAAQSGMVSVIGLDIETVEKLCARTRELTGGRPCHRYHGAGSQGVGLNSQRALRARRREDPDRQLPLPGQLCGAMSSALLAPPQTLFRSRSSRYLVFPSALFLAARTSCPLSRPPLLVPALPSHMHASACTHTPHAHIAGAGARARARTQTGAGTHAHVDGPGAGRAGRQAERREDSHARAQGRRGRACRQARRMR